MSWDLTGRGFVYDIGLLLTMCYIRLTDLRPDRKSMKLKGGMTSGRLPKDIRVDRAPSRMFN